MYNRTVNHTDAWRYLETFRNALADVKLDEVVKAAELILAGKNRDSSIWIVGNGGSAATASHFANDLIKMAGVKSLSLPDQTATVLAYSNDDGYDSSFSGPLRVLFRPDDILVAISCSGASENVLEAAVLCYPENLIIVSGGQKAGNILATRTAHAKITVEANDIRVREDIHMIICHTIAGLVRDA